jgi:hypothetical protein
MPPYTKPTSEAQRRYMFVLAKQGKISQDDAIGKSEAVKGRKLPKHVRPKKRTSKRR